MTLLIAHVERSPPASGDDPLRPADVNHHRLRAQHDPSDGAITGEALHRLGGDRQRESHLAGRRPAQPAERFEGCRDLHVRPLSASLRQHACVQPMAGQLDQGVGLALLATPIVLRASQSGQRLEGGTHGRAGGWVQPAVQPQGPVLVGIQVEPAIPRPFGLVGCHTLRISRMTDVLAVVPEAADAALAGRFQEEALVEGLTRLRGGHGVGRAGDQ